MRALEWLQKWLSRPYISILLMLLYYLAQKQSANRSVEADPNEVPEENQLHRYENPMNSVDDDDVGPTSEVVEIEKP